MFSSGRKQMQEIGGGGGGFVGTPRGLKGSQKENQNPFGGFQDLPGNGKPLIHGKCFFRG